MDCQGKRDKGRKDTAVALTGQTRTGFASLWHLRIRESPFLFQTVEGDFDVRARVRVRGPGSETPGGTWSLGGLMARVPSGLDFATWQPRRENSHFITMGVGLRRHKAVTETKGDRQWQSQVRAHPLADPNLAEVEILEALGA